VDEVAHLFGAAGCIRHTDRSVPPQMSVRLRARRRDPTSRKGGIVCEELLDGSNRS
jgi:hypothetical protein